MLHSSSLFLVAVLMVITSLTLMAAPTIIWVEGENAIAVPDGLPSKTAKKPPASGGKSLLGKAFAKKGNTIVYEVNLPESMTDVHMVMRYSRLHVMRWTAAEVKVTVKAPGVSLSLDETIDQTGGWGSQKSEDWGFHAMKLGNLPAGKVAITFVVQKDNSDLNLDGIFFSSGPIPLKAKDFAGCGSVQISQHGFVGLKVANPAINQRAFSSIKIVSRGFDDHRVSIAAELLDQEGKVHRSLIADRSVTLSTVPQVVEISSRDLSDLRDGAYTVRVRLDNEARTLSSSLVAMGDLLAHAASKADSYETYIAKLEPKVALRMKGDLVYAVEYIRNALLLLQSRDGQLDADSAAHKKTMAYFEKAQKRTALSFSNDLRRIIEQTDETISRMDKGVDPYQGRSGDLRRAFYSKFSGQLEPYRVLIPASYWSAKSYKFLLALHGAGGDENYFPENDRGSFARAAAKLEYVVASPKANLKYRGGGKQDMKELVELMQVEYPRIDKDQCFCTGVSMGGGGTYRLTTTYPDLFKAAAVVSSGLRGEPNATELDRLKDTPILILHGKLDSVNPVATAYSLADELKKRGFTYDIEVYPKNGHAYYGATYLERSHKFFQKHK